MSKSHKIFIPIKKIDEERRLVYGIATEELPDKQGEICDYETSKPYYEKWSANIEKATDGKSKGNLRVMHSNKVAGTIPEISFNDVEKQIEICAKVIDDDEWKMVLAGGYTGFSQGGSYEKKWKDGEFTRYTSNPCEISLVDNPCLPSATFEVIKSDGSLELRKFKTLEQDKMTKNIDKDVAKAEVIQGWQATDGSFHLSKADAIAHTESVEKAAAEEKEKKDMEAADKPKDGEVEKTEDEKKDMEASDKPKDADEKKDMEASDKPKDGEVEKADDEKEPDAKDDAKEKDDSKDGDKPKEDEKDDAKKSIGADFKKWIGSEVFDASCAIDALISIMLLLDSEEWEAKMSGNEDAGQLADLKIVIEKLKSFIASEIMEDNTEGAEKSAKGDLEKAGASISAKNKQALDKMYKSAKDHLGTMEECVKGMTASLEGKEPDAGVAQNAVTDNVDGNVNVDTTNHKATETNELQKKLEDKYISEVQKLTGTVDALLKRVKELEDQPAASKGVRLVLKDHEGEIGDKSSVEADTASILKNIAGEPPMVQAERFIKAIQSAKK